MCLCEKCHDTLHQWLRWFYSTADSPCFSFYVQAPCGQSEGMTDYERGQEFARGAHLQSERMRQIEEDNERGQSDGIQIAGTPLANGEIEFFGGTEPLEITLFARELQSWLAAVERGLEPVVQFDMDNRVMLERAYDLRGEVLQMLARRLREIAP